MHFRRMTLEESQDKELVPQKPATRKLYLIKQLQYKMYMRLEAALEATGVTAAQFRTLSALSTDAGKSSADLSRKFGVKPQTMFKQISQLEQNGLIYRTVAEHNKRVLKVDLTEEGRRVLEECDRCARALEDQLFEPLTEAEQALFKQFILILLQSLKQDEN